MRRVEIVFAFVAACATTFAAPPEGKSVQQGAYSSAQAAHGKAVYLDQCSRCHREDLTGASGVLIGSHFMQEWSQDSVGSFYKIMRQTMPANAPGSLSQADYLAIVAYVLQMNEFPAGQKELTADDMANIRIEGKEGPAPVPDFSLVVIVGCMGQKADGSWVVTKASEPVRTRDPGDPGADEMQALKAQAFGSHTFGLLDFSGVQPHPEKDKKVEVKGLLIRKPGDDKLNPSSVKTVAESCGQ